jgi:hypothetical protein
MTYTEKVVTTLLPLRATNALAQARRIEEQP